MLLSRRDVLAALKIRRLLAQAEDPGATEHEAVAYREKARTLARRHRYGETIIRANRL